MQNSVIEIISNELFGYINKDTLNRIIDNGQIKYVFSINDYYFEIKYQVMDNFYRIKVENIKCGYLQSLSFFTKSKQYRKDVANIIKNLKLCKSKLASHIFALTVIIKENINQYGDLHQAFERYADNLKFDGIFL